jgi:hypothetical protein
LITIDEVSLSPHYRRPGKRELASVLDFQAVEREQPVFWIELKTGQRGIEEFATFQLDYSDCDDILNVVKLERLPAYVFHVQLAREYRPPSAQVLGVGIWWTDVYAMSEAFVKSERRSRNGGKMAAHFSPGCFRPLLSLGHALREGHHVSLGQRLRESGPPSLYR